MGTSIATRLIALLTAIAVLIIGAGMLLDYRLSRQEILQRLTEQAVTETRVMIGDMENWLNGVESTTRLLAQVLQQRQYSPAGLRQLLRDVVTHNDNVFGAAIALNPAITDRPRGFAPYYFTQEGQIRYADLTTREARYTEQAWFTEPVAQERAVWSEPYFDAGGSEINMTTFSVPVYHDTESGGRELYAVVTADVSVAALHSALQQLHLGESSYGLLFSRHGLVISSRSPDSVMKHYSQLHYKGLDLDSWRDMFQRALKGETSTRSFPCAEQAGRCTIRLGRLQTTGWAVGVGFEQREVLAPLHSFEIKTALISLTTLALVALAVYGVTSRLTRPLSDLTHASENMARGDLDTPMPRAAGKDEIARLVNAFSSMNQKLKTYVADLEVATANRARLEGELSAARDIQMSMLPEGGNALLRAEAVTVWAKVLPARTVGGDLYTYLRDEDQLFIAVGDVSDKGVPAALFMARAISLIQQLAGAATPPDEALSALNNALERDNASCMFVTLFLGVLDIRSGALRFASAGHTAPSLLREGTVTVQEQEAGPALGLVADQSYPDNRLQLRPGDRLAIYTDGIDEAFNLEDQMFGVDAFNIALQQGASLSAADAGDALFEAVAAHSAGKPQSDDITLLLLDFVYPAGSRVGETFQITGALTKRVHHWMTSVLAEWNIQESIALELKLVAEEIVTNIQKYGGAAEDGQIGLTLTYNGPCLALEAVDHGIAFNPLEESVGSALGASIESAEIGGLGVHLVIGLTDRQSYRRENGTNVLRVEKSLA